MSILKLSLTSIPISSQGHGEYSELCTEKEFFTACGASENLACHVYRRGSPHCDILDMHLRALSAKHVECRFVKMDAEKAPFLTGKCEWVHHHIIKQLVQSQARLLADGYYLKLSITA